MFMCLLRIRRKASNAVMGVGRALATPCACLFAPRRRNTVVLVLVILLSTAVVFLIFKARLPREDLMEQKLAQMQIRIEYVNRQYRAQQEDLIIMQQKNYVSNMTGHNYALAASSYSPEAIAILQKNLTGTKAGAGLNQTNIRPLKMPFAYQLMPHLMDDIHSLRPAYHMSSSRDEVEFVIGIPTVKRDKENYLMITLTHLVNGLSEEEANSTLIVILVGETDLEYVVGVAKNVENEFPKQVECGLIEVLSPSPGYYPNFSTITPSLGDSHKRTKWRTKQNLDTMYLMAYGQSKGTFYLMLEDDVISEKSYIRDMKHFITSVSVTEPGWIWIEFCSTGGIGKLFKASHIPHFVTYLQLFYANKPIDWLISTYLMDKMCAIDKSTKECQAEMLKVRPKFKRSLFQHIGLYSSLKGKIVKVENHKVEPQKLFYPHKNPPVDYIRTNLEPYAGHTINDAYEGKQFFWALVPKENSYIEFCFEKPTFIESYIFRSGNVEKTLDKFYQTVVEVLALNSNGSYVTVGTFDEFGLAEGKIPDHLGPLFVVRIRVLRDGQFWVILSEILLKPYNAAMQHELKETLIRWHREAVRNPKLKAWQQMG